MTVREGERLVLLVRVGLTVAERVRGIVEGAPLREAHTEALGERVALLVSEVQTEAVGLRVGLTVSESVVVGAPLLVRKGEDVAPPEGATQERCRRKERMEKARMAKRPIGGRPRAKVCGERNTPQGLQRDSLPWP
jgi:hypothetical protein